MSILQSCTLYCSSHTHFHIFLGIFRTDLQSIRDWLVAWLGTFASAERSSSYRRLVPLSACFVCPSAPFVCPSASLSALLSACLSVALFQSVSLSPFSLSLCLPFSLSLCLPFSLSLRLPYSLSLLPSASPLCSPVNPSIALLVCLYVSPSVSICLPVSPSVSLPLLVSPWHCLADLLTGRQASRKNRYYLWVDSVQQQRQRSRRSCSLCLGISVQQCCSWEMLKRRRNKQLKRLAWSWSFYLFEVCLPLPAVSKRGGGAGAASLSVYCDDETKT